MTGVQRPTGFCFFSFLIALVNLIPCLKAARIYGRTKPRKLKDAFALSVEAFFHACRSARKSFDCSPIPDLGDPHLEFHNLALMRARRRY